MEDIIAAGEEYISLKEQKGEIEKRLKEIEHDFLIPYADTILFPDLKKKITYIPEKTTTKINNEKLFDTLFEKGKIEIIRTHFSITEKELMTIEDGEEYVKLFKEEKGKTKPSFRVSKMTNKELLDD